MDAAIKARQFVEGLSFESFSRDDKSRFAIVRALEVIGEAAKRVPEKVRLRHKAVPWISMAGVRDKLIHDYTGVDWEVVWKTVVEDVPELITAMAEIQEREGSDDA